MTASVGIIEESDLDRAVEVLAVSFLDNPIEKAVFSDDRNRRHRQLRRLFAGLLRASPRTLLAARVDDQFVGVLVAAPPGSCQPSFGLALRLGIDVIKAGPTTALRAARWQLGWRRHHLRLAHDHLVLLGVIPEHQGHGRGSELLAAHLREVDRKGLVSYLETDRHENVAFYERHGYRVNGESNVVGQPNWFMVRGPGGTDAPVASSSTVTEIPPK